MAHQVRACAAKPSDLSLSPRAHVVERNDSHKLSSDLRHAMHPCYALKKEKVIHGPFKHFSYNIIRETGSETQT